jgi:serine/threonine-protein kinase
LSPTAAAAIGAAAADALDYVHRQGLLHRDVKCSNLMLVQQCSRLGERVRLIDFGTVAAVEPTVGRVRKVVGSVAYLAPELLRAEAEASAASDVYGLGVVLYRMLTGRVPYPGTVPGDVLAAMASSPIVELPRLDMVSSTMASLVEATLRARGDRPSAGELARKLRRLADDEAHIEIPRSAESSAATRTVWSERASSKLDTRGIRHGT